MAEPERIRIEIAFEGTQVLTVYVPTSTADDLDRALIHALHIELATELVVRSSTAPPQL